ncbi:MAG: hypothetical protein AAF500_02045 [Myxococcota bacterium]
MRAMVAAVVFIAALAANASAVGQDAWVVLPATVGTDQAWIAPTTAEVRKELRERRVEVWSGEAQSREFEARESAPAARVSNQDVQAWVDRSSKALTYLAGGDYAKARREFDQLQKLSKQVAEELNRQRERAQEVLDSCLDMVRLMLETRTRGEAKAQALACRQLVPRVEPGENRHPPAVMDVLRSVDRDTDQMGTLTIESEPSGCAFRINGLSFGTTPDSMSLFFGEYRVQAECSQNGRGRVHPVRVDSSNAKVEIDARFDSVIRTRPFLELRYPDKKAMDKWLKADAGKVASVLRTEPGNVLLITAPQPGMLRFERVRAGSSSSQGVAVINTTPSGPTREDVDLAVKAVLKGECQDFSGARATTLAGCGKPSARSGRTPKPLFWSGVALASLGSASLLAGWALHAVRGQKGDSWQNDTSNVTLQTEWLNLGSATMAMGIAGGAITTAAMPLVLPYRDKTPWWAWLSGGLGVASLVGMTVSWISIPATRPPCKVALSDGSADAERCVNHGQKRDRTVLFAATAAPLLTMPLVYLFRRKDSRVTANVEIRSNGGRLMVSGRF